MRWALLLAAGLVGCPLSTAGNPETYRPRRLIYRDDDVKIWRDDVRGVTCYMNVWAEGGMSCIPDGAAGQLKDGGR